MPRRVALLAVLLACGLASAQEDGLGGKDREPTPEMLRVSPELKGKIGLEKEQLIALFFELDAKKPDAKKVRALFSIERDQALLERYLTEKGRYRAQSGLRAVVAGLGSSGFAWALDRFENGKPESRGRALDALSATEARETWDVLERALQDERPVPDWRAAQEAPPGYKALRVCDHALRLLGSKLLPVVKDPPETRVSSLQPLEERDALRKKLEAFLAKDETVRRHRAALPAVK